MTPDHPPTLREQLWTAMGEFAAACTDQNGAAAWRAQEALLRIYDAAGQPDAGDKYDRAVLNLEHALKIPGAGFAECLNVIDRLMDDYSKPHKAAAPPQVEPAGWVLVPVGPTEAMVKAGRSESLGWDVHLNAPDVRDLYRAMIQAAPTHDAAGVEKDAARYRWLVETAIEWNEIDDMNGYIIDRAQGTWRGCPLDEAIDAAMSASKEAGK